MGELETPWNRARKTRSERQEKRLGSLPGGKQGVNSGRIWRWKRDGQIGEFLIECRTNEKPTVRSYRIEYDEFVKIKREAQQTPPGLLAGMQIDILDLSLITVETTVFTAILERLVLLEAQVEEVRKAAKN